MAVIPHSQPLPSPGPMPTAQRPTLPQVYDAYFNYVWTILRRLGVWDRDLEDATHDVFIVVHRRLTDYDPQRPIKPWIAGIATRVASEFRRRAQHRREVVSEDQHMELAHTQQPNATPSKDASHQLEDKQKRALVQQALEHLSDDRRTVLVLHDMDGNGMPEIAAALGVNINTLYARLRAARQDFANAVNSLRQGAI